MDGADQRDPGTCAGRWRHPGSLAAQRGKTDGEQMDKGGNQHEGKGGNSGGHSWLAIRMVQALLTRVARRAYDKPVPLAENAGLDPPAITGLPIVALVLTTH